MMEPYMVAKPVVGSVPGGVAAAPIAMRGETAVKVTPWIRGSFTPMKRPMPADWIIVRATGEQVSVDEVDKRVVVEPESGGDNERDDHGTRVEREDVLNTQNGEFPKGRNLIDGVGSGRGA